MSVSRRGKGQVTVLIPTITGREQMCRRAIESVEAQTRKPDLTMVVVDRDRLGCAEMKNRMVARATTEWVAFLDDDDWLLPQHIKVLMEEAERRPEYDLFYPWFEPVGMADPLTVPVDGAMCSPYGVPFGAEQEKYLLEVDNFIPCTVLARREAILEAGGFQMSEPPSPVYDRDDLGLWRAMLLAGSRFYHVPQKTWCYVHHIGRTGGYPIERTVE